MSFPSTCALCQVDIGSRPHLSGDNAFCCSGCHTVYNILLSKNELGSVNTHPLFLQALRTGVISNPALLQQIQDRQQALATSERKRLHLEIDNMWCPSCAEIIRLLLLNERGITECVVDYTTDLASVEYSPLHTSQDRIFQVIKEYGYNPHHLSDRLRKPIPASLWLRFIVACFCALNAMMFAYPLYATYFDYDGEGYGQLFAYLSLLSSLPILFYSATPVWQRCYNSLKVGIYGMELLVTIGVLSAFLLSLADLYQGGDAVYFDSMSVIIVFVLLGKIIESKSKFSAKESLLHLNLSGAKRGRKLFTDGKAAFVTLKEIEKGDTLIAYQGEKVVLDGVAIEGGAAVDESIMTGEAIPVVKRSGDPVLCGSIISCGTLTYRATTKASETVLQKIIELIEQDIGHKSIYTRAADHIVKWFVPAVLLIAFITAAWFRFDETAYLRFLSILLISCPCAIGIAAPTAESSLLNKLAALGVVIRNRGVLTLLGKETVVIFDKTGTVTEGKYKVLSDLTHLETHELSALGGLASESIHPAAIACTLAAQGHMAAKFEKRFELAGQGLRGSLNGQEYALGSEKFMKDLGIVVPRILLGIVQEGLYSTVYFSRGDQLLASIALGDEIKPQFSKILKEFKHDNVKTILLSGDSVEPVKAVATQLGFDEWHAGMSPMEKRELVDRLRKNSHVVCMVGDGINDAPCLTAANIGISVVTASEMSIQVSDILLTTPSLSTLNEMRKLAKKGQWIVRENLFWAFIFNVIGIGLAVFGLLTPIFAAAAMSISSLVVLFNAKRLE